MPAIPIYQQRTSAGAGLQLARVNPSAATAPAQALSSLGETITQAAPQIADIVERVTISNNAWQLAQKTAETLGELDDYRGQLAADEDYDSHSAKYLAKAKEIEDRVGQEMPGGLNRIWRQDFRRVSLSNSVSVAAEAQKLKAGKVRAQLGNTLLSLSELTGVDPATDDAVRAQARIAVEANAASGNLSFEERNKMLADFDLNSVEAAVRRDILNDPEMAERKLAAGLYKGLTGEAQAVWAQRTSDAAESAQRRALQAEDHAYTTSQRAKKEAADALSKQGDHMLASGQLSPDWIENNRDSMDPADFRYFYKTLKGGSGEGPRDSSMFADLVVRSGKGEDVRDEARQALQSGAIRSTDFSQIVNNVEGARPGWYKRGTSYISTMAAVSEINPDPASAQNKAGMLDEWNDWADQHPQATMRDAQIAYQDIVSNNSLVQLGGLPLPKLHVGDRFNMDIEASEKATAKAYQEGKLSRADAEREAQLLAKWRRALAPTPQAPQ